MEFDGGGDGDGVGEGRARGGPGGASPYTVRSDALPKRCPSMAALHVALFRDTGIDGVFTDFTDVTRAWLGR